MKLVNYGKGMELGGCVHGVTGNFVGSVSVYLDETGQAKDMEQIYANGRTRTVKPYCAIWNYCARIGGMAWLSQFTA